MSSRRARRFGKRSIHRARRNKDPGLGSAGRAAGKTVRPGRGRPVFPGESDHQSGFRRRSASRGRALLSLRGPARTAMARVATQSRKISRRASSVISARPRRRAGGFRTGPGGRSGGGRRDGPGSGHDQPLVGGGPVSTPSVPRAVPVVVAGDGEADRRRRACRAGRSGRGGWAGRVDGPALPGRSSGCRWP